MVAFFEPAPAADGRRAVLYLDGHVTRVSETDWPRIRQASRIPP
jgi:prepilin-type processing-associated H-X9-DG protein